MANEGNRTVWDQLNDEGMGNIGKPYPTNPNWGNGTGANPGMPQGAPQGFPANGAPGVPMGVPDGAPPNIPLGESSSPRPLRTMIPSAQSNVMSASQFAQANRANLERLAATAKHLENSELGDNPASQVVNNRRSDDRFVPSPEAVMDSLVVSTELPRAAVRRRVENTSAIRDAEAKRSAKFPGAVDPSRKMELGRKLAIALSLLCFLLAGGLLYYYFFSPYGPHNTTEAALNFSASLDQEAKNAPQGVSTITPRPAEVDNAGVSASEEATGTGNASAIEDTMTETIKVHVGGEVNKPGLIDLPLEARIDDAVKAAGGFTADANRESVNLASFVSDGDQIIVASKSKPSESENKAVAQPAHPSRSKARPSRVAQEAASQEVPAASVARSAASGHRHSKAKAAPAGGSSAAAGGEVVFARVNINTASEIELLQLRGIGPQLAQAIIEYRSSLPNQRFTNAEQLGNVAGIGEAKLAQMLPQVEL